MSDAGTYTGEVKAGGAPDVRELDALRITKVAVDEQMSNNCYLLTCKRTGDQVLIDAADASATLLPLIGDAGLTHVITTHQHWDHHRALPDVVGATGAATVAGDPDAEAITEQTGVPIALQVRHGDTVPVGDCTLEVIALAGHTPGSIALLYDDSASEGGHPHLFTGDSLFPGGVGNTFGDQAAFEQLIDEVSTKIFDRLPDDTWFYPGHGNDSTLRAERPHLQEWRERGW
ncbi:MBL fold metallo-hydrolase [Nocardioides halotolerans]|uniref:MBL fold metallo-hydrolase n=1 Tax=Nocardioides halotolerans TaxID=433660 RepID=UPI00048C0A6F|nr:MBL fold metallo-hydrolase [Nocardioides halotolerans]